MTDPESKNLEQPRIQTSGRLTVMRVSAQVTVYEVAESDLDSLASSGYAAWLSVAGTLLGVGITLLTAAEHVTEYLTGAGVACIAFAVVSAIAGGWGFYKRIQVVRKIKEERI